MSRGRDVMCSTMKHIVCALVLRALVLPSCKSKEATPKSDPKTAGSGSAASSAAPPDPSASAGSAGSAAPADGAPAGSDTTAPSAATGSAGSAAAGSAASAQSGDCKPLPALEESERKMEDLDFNGDGVMDVAIGG